MPEGLSLVGQREQNRTPVSLPFPAPLGSLGLVPETREEEEEICSWWNKEAGLIHLRFDPVCVWKVCVHSASLSCAKVPQVRFGSRHTGHCGKSIF